MSAAPLYPVAEGPDAGAGFYVQASDGVKLRLGLWQHEGARGTVLLVPGRTEYIEKYGRAAGDLRARGYATLVIDLRGQGLADRPLGDRLSGHVGDFLEYQLDLQAMLAFARAKGLPEPFYLLSHSMGGCIALRALTQGFAVKAAAFSAPMWGISIAAWMRPAAMALAQASRIFGFAGKYAPGTGPKTYVLSQGFAGNTLTSDPEMWDYMRRQAEAQPDLSLGGPSLGWLNAALSECQALSRLASPNITALAALGTAEKIVDTAPIHLRMARWPKGALQMYPMAEHEVMMEAAATRKDFFDRVAACFDAAG
ncbi:MAG: alpha/beta fold hydrolase [Cypionkella sp.]